jgi:hypothetical protein
MQKRTYDQINWVRPSAEDIVYLQSISAEEHKRLLRDMLDAAAASGETSDTMEDIWREAVRRASELACAR